MQNKRGMSQIVTTVIIVVLVLVAIGIVWGVVSNVITDSADDVTLTGLKIDLDIQSAYKDEGGDIVVRVKRLAGEGDLTGIKFILINDTESEIFEETVSMEELSEETFTFTPTIDADTIEKVEIAPIFSTGSGSDTLGDVSDSMKVGTGDSVGGGGECTPNCDGKLCGDDGCGGVCGTCEEPTPDCGPEFTCVESCTPTTCIAEGYECGEPSDGCGGILPSCGTCSPIEYCSESYTCANITYGSSRNQVDSTWPPGLATYLDSPNLSVFELYTDDYILVTSGTATGACYLIFDYILPIEPETYNYSHMRLGVTVSTGITTGDTFDIWPDFDSCSAASALLP